jgi:hypothetical protein
MLCSGFQKEAYYQGKLEVDGKLMLICILEKWDRIVKSGLMALGIDTIDRILWTLSGAFGFHKVLGNFLSG